MANKKVLTSLDFERKAQIVAPVIGTESRSGITVAPDGSLVYDATANANPLLAEGFYGRIGAQFRKFLTSADLSTDIDFDNDGGLLANRDTIRQYVESVLTSIGGSFKGAWDPTGGIVPNSPNIKAGDSWRISVAANIPGLPGDVTQVEVGDLLIASVDNPANATEFFVLQTNIADASNILLGNATPTPGPVEATDSVQLAIRKLIEYMNVLPHEIDFSARAGGGIRYDSSTGAERYSIDLAPNSGLELTDNTENAQLRIKGLADYSAVAVSDRVAVGYDANGNLVVNKAAFVQDLTGLAGQGLTFNTSTGKIDLGGQINTEPVNLIVNSEFNIVDKIVQGSAGPYISATVGFSMKPGLMTLAAGRDYPSEHFGGKLQFFAEPSSYFPNYPASANPGRIRFSSGALVDFDLNKNIVIRDEFGFLTYASIDNLLEQSSSSKFSATITGNASATSFTVTHNKNSKDVLVQVFDVATDDEVEVTISRTTVNTVDIIFAVAPPSGQSFRVVVI